MVSSLTSKCHKASEIISHLSQSDLFSVVSSSLGSPPHVLLVSFEAIVLSLLVSSVLSLPSFVLLNFHRP
jgi:hypothetical protein